MKFFEIIIIIFELIFLCKICYIKCNIDFFDKEHLTNNKLNDISILSYIYSIVKETYNSNTNKIHEYYLSFNHLINTILVIHNTKISIINNVDPNYSSISNKRKLEITNNTLKQNSYNKETCNDGMGKLSEFVIDSYICNNKEVTKTNYNYFKSLDNNLCKKLRKTELRCVCSSNYEGRYCQKPISNVCEFSAVNLNDINLLEYNNVFYDEYLKDHKITMFDFTDNKIDNKLKFKLKLSCSLLRSSSNNRIKLPKTNVKKFDNRFLSINIEKYDIISEKNIKINSYDKFFFNNFNNNNNTYIEKDKDLIEFKKFIHSRIDNWEFFNNDTTTNIVLKNEPLPEEFLIDISFYNMKTLLKEVEYLFKIPSDEVLMFMNNNLEKEFTIDFNNPKLSNYILNFNNDNYKATKEKLKNASIVGVLYYQINFISIENSKYYSNYFYKKYKKIYNKFNFIKITNSNKDLVKTITFNGEIVIDKNMIFRDKYFDNKCYNFKSIYNSTDESIIDNYNIYSLKIKSLGVIYIVFIVFCVLLIFMLSYILLKLYFIHIKNYNKVKSKNIK